jgi:hypothetical protein
LLFGEHNAFHVTFEVAVDIFEHQVEFVLPRDYFFHAHYVGVVQFLQQRDLADGSGGDAFVLMVQSDFLDCHDFVGDFISGFIDNAIGAFTDFVDALVAVDFAAG